MSNPVSPEELARIRAEARRSVGAQTGFRWHFAAYVGVCVLLVAINLLTTPLVLWSAFPVLGWGLGVAIHAFALRGRTDHEAAVEAEVQRRLRLREA